MISESDWRVLPVFLLAILKAHFRTGIDGKPTTFLFGDQQIKDEAFLEDISALLR